LSNSILPYDDSNRQPLSFDFNGNPLTANIENGEPQFFASDVCNILEIVNVAQAVARLDDDEKGITTVYTLGGSQDVLTVNESGLYSLVLTSRKSQAKAFKRWITHEVLPAIRKTGTYSLQQMSPLQQLKAMVAHMEQTERQINELHQLQAEQAQRIESVVDRLDKADYFTVQQFCQRQGIKSTPAIRQMWGKQASDLSRQRSIYIDKVIEGAYSVNAYHKNVLLEVCVAKVRHDSNQLPLSNTGS
jgi:prophage antirepressor-like protein